MCEHFGEIGCIIKRPHCIILFYVQWGAIITWRIFSNILTKNTPSYLYSASVTAVMCAISCCIAQHYIGTRMFMLGVYAVTVTNNVLCWYLQSVAFYPFLPYSRHISDKNTCDARSFSSAVYTAWYCSVVLVHTLVMPSCGKTYDQLGLPFKTYMQNIRKRWFLYNVGSILIKKMLFNEGRKSPLRK